MLNLYSARENIDKERFIYENIKGEAVVIVPNQYTVVAEEQAMKYLGTKCLFNVEIMSINRLGLRVLTEQGNESVEMLDKYGRFMLLTKIIKEHKDELKTFAKSAGKVTFTAMINDFIADYKQQECSFEDVRDLNAKIQELEGIVNSYEDAIQGVYTDSEDYIAMYVDAIKDSKWLEGKSIWIYGYDSVTPKFLGAVRELERKCESVNLIVNESDFNLDEILVRRIKETIESARLVPIVAESRKQSDTIAAIEKGLFNDDIVYKDMEPEDLTVVRAANPYYEAESAAIYVCHLVRDLGYRMRDIQIIANDEGVMQPIIRRTFAEYGLPIFMDQARVITDSAVVSFIVNLLKFAEYKKTEDLMSMLKTNFAGVNRDDIEQLENYANRFHIKKSMWDRPFKFGAEQLGEETFQMVESLRSEIAERVGKLDDISKNTSVGKFIADFRTYLDSEWKLADRVIDAVNEQTDMLFYEEAQRTAESYKQAIELLGQIEQIMGEEKLELAEFIEIYMAGLTDVEVGVIPPTADGLSMGTMIRTRPRSLKAVVILGANEGTLPLEPSTEGLFSVEEKAYFREKGFALGNLDDIKMAEESVAMYRMLSKPSEKLYVSYAMTDANGKEQSPSEIIDALQDLFPKLEVKKDVISEGWSQELFAAGAPGMRHLINHVKDRNAPAEMDELTASALSWYEHNDADTIKEMLNAAQDENDPRSIGSSMASGLFSRKGNLVLSASSISNYNDCPFKFFIDKGIKPEEERAFSSDPRSIGDVYHECLEKIAKKIVADKSYGEKLQESSDAELEAIIADELAAISKDYQGGLFISSSIEEYRLERIKEICVVAVRALAEQLSSSSVTDANFEESFGRGKKFAPLEFEVDGQKVYVEGKIDRADILNDERVRIIDYKTGNDSFSAWKASHGYKMQLMIYLISATSGSYEPAGMFYFNISDPMQSLNDKNEAKEATFKLRGKYVDEPGVLESMPKEVMSGKELKISRAEYETLKSDVLTRIDEIAGGIASGKIGIRPLKPNQTLVCNYCKYRAICKRDREYARNAAREIPPQPKKKDKDQ